MQANRIPMTFPSLPPISLVTALTVLVLPIVTLSAQQSQPGADNNSSDAVKQQFTEAQQKIKKLSATDYDLDGIRINAATREIRIPALVHIRRAPLEYALVHETGDKVHESILTTKIRPLAIQVALLLANYEPASQGLLANLGPDEERPKWQEVPPQKPGANRVAITVEWKEAETVKRAPLSDWIQNSETRKPPPDLQTWIFNGSRIGDRGFAAQAGGSIISVYLDLDTILNSPARGCTRDDLWISNPSKIPPEGTEVVVVVAPAA